MIQQYRLYYYSLWSVIALLFPLFLSAQNNFPVDITVDGNGDGAGMFTLGTINNGLRVSTCTTLRGAIENANNNAALQLASKITIHFSQPFTINQTNGTYNLTRSNVVIDGRDANNAPGTTISSNGKDVTIFKLSGVPTNCQIRNFKIQKPNACSSNDATNPCTAILDYGDYTIIENNILTNLANSNGITTHGQHATIRNNQLSGTAASPNTTSAISINNAGQGPYGKYAVYNNTISNFNIGITIQDNQSNFIYRNNISCVKTAISLINTIFLDPNPTITTATTDEISGNAFNNDGAYPDSVQVFLYKNQSCAAGYTICPSGLYLGIAKVTGSGNTYIWKLPKTSFAQAVAANDQVSAYSMTKTNAGSMSDYKNTKCVTVTGASSACIFSQTKEIIVINANDDGVGSLREAINCTNTITGGIIRFKLPAGGFNIEVGKTSKIPLPPIKTPVTIYGEEQVTIFKSVNIPVNVAKPESGIFIISSNVHIYGMIIKGFEYGIQANDANGATPLNNINIGSPTKGYKNTIVANDFGIINFYKANIRISNNSITCNTTKGISSIITKPPTITSYDNNVITGTALAYAEIELFYTDDYCANTKVCQGKTAFGVSTADAKGNWSFTSVTGLNTKLDVTATATETFAAANNISSTSEFAACKSATVSCCQFDAANTIYVTTTADEGCGSLREAINCTNTISGGIIRFKLSTGNTSIEIGKTSKIPLPPIKTPVTIYGDELISIYKSPSLIRDPKQLESGFFIISPNVKVYGMKISGFYYGIQVSDGNKAMNGIIIGDAKQVGYRNTIEFNTIGIANYVISNVRISGNAIACNKNFGIESSVIKKPVITFFDKYAVKGTSYPNAEIEVFYNDPNYCDISPAPPCQGRTYMGATQADANGDWVLKSRIEIDELFNTNLEVTATATIQTGLVIAISPPPPANTTSDFAICKKYVPCTGITVTKPPRDTVFDCSKASNAEYQNWIKINGGAVVSSDCGVIKYGFFSTTPYPKTYDCRNVVPVTFVFDDGTNKKEIQANFIIEDKTPPILTKPCDLTVSCSKAGKDSIYTWLLGNCISYTDCNASKIIVNNSELAANPRSIFNDFDSTKVVSYPCINGRRTITVTFSAEDVCGNIGKIQGTLTIIDRQPPIILLPKDVNLAETEDYKNLDKTGRATIAYNFCDKNLTPTYSDQITRTKCQRLIKRTWSATDGCGNTGTATQTLIQPLPPITAKITGDTTICVGGSTILDAGAGYTYLWSTNATTQTITVRDVGTYSVVITDANQCIARTSVKITIKTAVIPTITGNTPFCVGKSITLSVKETYSKYEWDTKETTQSITVSASVRYTVSVTDAQGCQGTATVSTSTYPTPRPMIESSSEGVCTGKGVTLTAKPSAAEPAYVTYSWSDGSKTAAILVNEGGAYRISVIDVNSCIGTASKTIATYPQPIFDATTVLVTCNPTNGNANVDGKIKLTNFSANDRYDFSAGTTYAGNKDYSTATAIGMDSLLTKTLANPPTTQTYTIRAFTKDGCFVDKTVTLAKQDCKVPCNLTASATNSGAVCIGGKVTVSVTPANMKYLWSDGTTAQQFETTKAGTYSVTVTDANNCTATANTTVIINTLPIVNISSSKEICVGTETTITASGGGNYKWSNGETTPEIKVKPTTNTIYAVTVTATNTCTATASSTITVNSLPNFEAVTQLVSCSPTGIANTDGKIKLTNFSANDRFDFTAGTTYTGTKTYNTATAIGTTDSLLTKILVNPTTTQAYTIRAFTKDGCFIDKTVTLAKQDCKVPCNLTATATNSGAKCAGGTVIVAATPANLTYIWSDGSTTQQFAVTTAGLYTVTVTDANKCTATASTTVSFYLLPSFEAITQLVICTNGTANTDGKIKLTNFSATDRFDFTAGTTYTGAKTYNTATAIGTDSLLTKTLANPTTTQSYTIRAFTKDGCFVDKTVTLAKQDCKIPCSLTATATNSGAVCIGGKVTVSATPVGMKYLWSDGTTTQQFETTKAGAYSVTVTDANNCTATASTSVLINPLPIVTISPNKDVCTGTETTITASGGATYKWNTNEITASIKVKPILTTDYLVSVTDANGCIGTASTKINVVSAPSFVVNAVTATCTGATPNSDAKLMLIGFKETERFDFMVGTLYTDTKTYTTAAAIPQNGSITSTLANPQTAQTYIVRVFNEANCFTDHTVVLNPKTDCKCAITVTIPSNSAACIGGNIALTASISGGTGVTYEWKNPSGEVVSTTTKLELTNVQATQNGTYTFTAKNSDGCTQSGNTTITVNVSPNFTAKATQTTCTNATPNSDAKLEIAGFVVGNHFDVALGNSYTGTKTYSTTAAIPASGILTGTLANPQTAQIYTIRVINDKECFTDKTVTLLPKTDCLQPCQIKASLAATNKGVVCIGTQETLKTTVTGATGVIKYAWSGADNFRSALPEVEITNIQSRQAGTYSVTATDFNNCTATASITLTVNEAPNFQLIAVKSTFTATCASNGDGSLSIAELTNGDRYDLSESATYTGNATYNTAKPIPTDKIVVQRIESPTTRQNYAIRVFNKNECFDTKSVAFDPQICSPNCVMQVTLPPNMSICAGEKLTIQATITNGTATQFIWKDAKGAIVSNKNTLEIPNIAREQRGIYSLRVTESGGCTKDAQIEVLVRDLPSLELGANRRVCANETTLLEAPTAETYKWSTGDDIRVIGVKPQIPTVYSLTVTNQFGCKNMDSIKLTIATVLAVTNLTRACVNDNFLVNFEVKGEPKIEIVEGKGTMRGNIFTSNLLPNKSTYNFVLKDACATFPVTGTHDCAAACTTSAGSMTINANAQTACVTGAVKAIFNNDFKSDGNDSLVFVLHDNPGNVLGEVLSVGKKPIFEFQGNLLTDKTYYISPVAGNKDTKTGVNFSDACLSVGKGAPISFKKAPPIPRELRGTAAVCTGQDILIETEKYEAADAKYRWIIPAANNKEDTITTQLPKYTIKNAQLKNAGSYFVFVETGGCQSTMLGPLDVKVAATGAGQVKVEKRAQHICQAVTQIDLKASAAPNGFSGIWLSLSGATVQAPTQNATKALNLKRGRNDFVWRVSSKECVAGTDTATIIFEFKPQPKPDQFTLDYTELVMDVLKNDSIISPKDVRVTLTKLPTEGTAEMLPNNKIRYTVRSDYEGDVLFTYKVCNTKAMCPDSCATANIGIKVLNVPDLPNFITPNEDGVNDFFPPEEVIENDQLIKLKVLIVNRWGDLVYINENILETQDAWRGDYRGNGKTLPEGAYFYFVEQTYKTKGKQPNKSGAIHLLLKEK